MFCVVVNQRSNSIKPQMVWEYTVVVRVAVRVDTSLQGRHNIDVFRRCYSTKEYGHAISQQKEHILFGLETEVQHVTLAKVQDQRVRRPDRLRDGDCGVEARDKQFQNPPEKVVPIPRGVSDT